MNTESDLQDYEQNLELFHREWNNLRDRFHFEESTDLFDWFTHRHGLTDQELHDELDRLDQEQGH